MNKIIRGIVTASIFFLVPQLVLAEGNAAAGKVKGIVCSACHGADGNSQTAEFPSLAGQGENYLIKQMKDIKSGTRTVAAMTGLLNNLTDQDMADVAAYFSSNTEKISGAKDKDLALGEKIYRQGVAETGVPACQGCHSPTGKGNDPAGYPALGGQHTAYLVKQLKDFRTGADDPENPSARNNDGETRIMRGSVAHLSDREIEAVSNYISGLH